MIDIDGNRYKNWLSTLGIKNWTDKTEKPHGKTGNLALTHSYQKPCLLKLQFRSLEHKPNGINPIKIHKPGNCQKYTTGRETPKGGMNVYHLPLKTGEGSGS